jgi:hypothetical protein
MPNLSKEGKKFKVYCEEEELWFTFKEFQKFDLLYSIFAIFIMVLSV